MSSLAPESRVKSKASGGRQPPVFIQEQRHGADAPHSPRTKSRIDWRGWIALCWILFWGTAYLRMAVAPRLTPAIGWLHSMIR
jgi:hypothetical protein